MNFFNLTQAADGFQIPVGGLSNELLGVLGLSGNDTIQGSSAIDRIMCISLW